ncbi:MAG: hypothetical protein LUO94_08790 [Methylococcaceae bacterium]|nr:hypothetical protein [Methylococcaceae bacterium]
MPIPTCAEKNLSLTVAFCTVVAISDCIASPAVQNNQFSSPASKDNSSNSSSASVDVSDLYNRDSSHAIQQLRKRGFYQVGARLSKSWWLYSNTIQCIQLEIANGKVMTIGPKSSQDCHSTR